MCYVSMVYDQYRDKIPTWPQQSVAPQPTTFPLSIPSILSQQAIDFDELRKLIAEFREAVALAKRLDVVTKQPDCEDPEKAKLEERVAELEKRLAGMAGAEP